MNLLTRPPPRSTDSSLISSPATSESAISGDTENAGNISENNDPVDLTNYQFLPLPDGSLAIAINSDRSIEKLVIPESYKGKLITQIADNGFSNCKSLNEVIIPNSVTIIGKSAFSGCTSLKTISLMKNITTIMDYAFCNCTALNDIVLPDTLKTIGKYSFSCCTSLDHITIPESVSTIDDYGFSRCTSLTSVVISEVVTSIGMSAFKGCSSLTIYCEAEKQPEGWDDS